MKHIGLQFLRLHLVIEDIIDHDIVTFLVFILSIMLLYLSPNSRSASFNRLM